MADKNSGKSILTGKKSTLSKKKLEEKKKKEAEKAAKREKKRREKEMWEEQGNAGGDSLDDIGLGRKYTNTIAHLYNPHK
jgi:hypothetical protein